MRPNEPSIKWGGRIPSRKGALLRVILWHAQTCPWSSCSALFARGQQRYSLGSGYRSAVRTCFQLGRVPYKMERLQRGLRARCFSCCPFNGVEALKPLTIQRRKIAHCVSLVLLVHQLNAAVKDAAPCMPAQSLHKRFLSKLPFIILKPASILTG